MSSNSEKNISVIVPIYNAGRYLKRCLESVLVQKVNKLQLILVNDGSTDESPEICNWYAKQYPDSIEVIHKKNEGVSVARQVGLSHVKYKYLSFVDSDDWINKETYQTVLSSMERESVDIAWFGRRDWEGESTELVFHEVVEDPLVCVQKIFSQEQHGAVWNKVFRTDLIQEYGVHFPKNYNYCEDWSFCIQAFLHAKRVKFIKEPFYNYFQHENSILHTLGRKELIDRFLVFGHTLNLLPEEVKERFKPEISFDIAKSLLEALRFSCLTLEEIVDLYEGIGFEIAVNHTNPRLSYSRQVVINDLLNRNFLIPHAHRWIKRAKHFRRKHICWRRLKHAMA